MPATVTQSSREADRHAPWFARIGWPVGVGIVALAVFALTLAPTVTAEDSGELIAAAWYFGIPHPPGYPLWTMLCGAFLRILPLGEVAWRANLFSAICSAVAAVLAFAALRQIDVTKPIAAGSALCWIFARWSWAQSVVTEVYGLNSLLTAGVLFCVLRWYRTKAIAPLLGGAFVLGLGICNHHTIALAGLAVVLWIVLVERQILRRWGVVCASVACFVAALLPYAYLPARASANPPINWGNPSNAERFWEHITRHQYGAIGPMKTPEPRSLPRLSRQLAYAGEAMIDDLTLPIVAIAGIGLVLLLRRNRAVFLLSTLWLACTGLLFVVLANYDLDRTPRWAMRVFFIPTWLGLIIPFAVCLDSVARAVAHRLRAQPLAGAAITMVLAAAGPAVQFVAHWTKCDYSNYWYAADHAENLLACVDDNALIFPSGDHSTFPMVYYLLVKGERPDVLLADMYGYVTPALLRERPSNHPLPPDRWLIQHERRPTYYTIKTRPDVVPAGVLYKLDDGSAPSDFSRRLAACTYRNESSSTVIDFGASHVLTDIAFFRGLDALGRGHRDDALAHFEQAAHHGRGIREVFNNLGSALAENGLSREAETRFRQAAVLDWRYVLPRWNLFRLFLREERWSDARAQLEQIIRADPDDARAYAEFGFLLSERFNDVPTAVRCWHDALRRNPDQPRVIHALGAVHRANNGMN